MRADPCPFERRRGRPYALIERVVTATSARRRGLGRRVIEHALRHAWSAACYKAMLLTGSADPGTHAFYRECGFSGTDKHGYVARPDSSEEDRSAGCRSA